MSDRTALCEPAASSTKRAHASTAAHDVPTIEAPTPTPRELLLLDLVLEIVAHADAATVVRCAAASRPLRRAVLDPAFRRRLGRRAAAHGGFDPALLVAVSCRHQSRVVVQASLRLRLDGSLARAFSPACSRDGLLILWRNLVPAVSNAPSDGELCALNIFTGHVTPLPRGDLQLCWNGSRLIYRPALLAVDRAGCSFELLVMNKAMRTQTFSSQDGKWSAVREVLPPPGRWPILKEGCTNPVVIGRTVHWLCYRNRTDMLSMPPFLPFGNPFVGDDGMFILALHADTAQATPIDLPEGCLSSTMSCTGLLSTAEVIMLATTTEGTRLSVVIAEGQVISMWTTSPEQWPHEWSRQVVIRRREIDRQLAASDHAYGVIRFQGFGERSGTLLFWMRRIGLVQLNLGTKKAVVLRRWSDSGRRIVEGACAHEINLVSLLGDMKIF
ncbi:hypothetical protein ACP70R_025543 [Stipagrostis hirtigluma subsp. patula]